MRVAAVGGAVNGQRAGISSDIANNVRAEAAERGEGAAADDHRTAGSAADDETAAS